jgi:MraZ protein
VFKGTYHHRIDAKGRLPVPAAFRRSLGEDRQVVVTLLDQCLAAYSPGEWARLEAQLAALPAFSKPVKALTRLLASRAADCEIDVQGRILLPPSLRQAAGLGRDAVSVSSTTSRSTSSGLSPPPPPPVRSPAVRPPRSPPRRRLPGAAIHRRNPTASSLSA